MTLIALFSFVVALLTTLYAIICVNETLTDLIKTRKSYRQSDHIKQHVLVTLLTINLIAAIFFLIYYPVLIPLLGLTSIWLTGISLYVVIETKHLNKILKRYKNERRNFLKRHNNSQKINTTPPTQHPAIK